jgi:hypothetical protein
MLYGPGPTCPDGHKPPLHSCNIFTATHFCHAATDQLTQQQVDKEINCMQLQTVNSGSLPASYQLDITRTSWRIWPVFSTEATVIICTRI